MPKKLASTIKNAVEKFFIVDEQIHEFTMGKTNDQKTHHRVRLTGMTKLLRSHIILLALKEIRREIAETARLSKKSAKHVVPGQDKQVANRDFYTKSLKKNQEKDNVLIPEKVPVVHVLQIRPLTEKKLRSDQKSLDKQFDDKIDMIFRQVLITQELDSVSGNEQIKELCDEHAKDFNLHKITIEIKRK
tara:strand:- start:790 stop:1356 length:567 start_codon:yes stop_codon:yes gene_type:complete